MKAPFRLTVRGRVDDLGPLELSQGGSEKRCFDIVDNSGLYFACCAMKHNARSSVLENGKDVVLYFGLGSGPIGTLQGQVYLMDDAFIVVVSQSPFERPLKKEQSVLQ